MPGSKLSFFDKHPATGITAIGLTGAFAVAGGVAALAGIMMLSINNMISSAVSPHSVLATTIAMGALALFSAVGNYILNKKAQKSQEYFISQEKITSNYIVGMISGMMIGVGMFAFARRGMAALPYAGMGLVMLIGLVIRNYYTECGSGCINSSGYDSDDDGSAIALD